MLFFIEQIERNQQEIRFCKLLSTMEVEKWSIVIDLKLMIISKRSYSAKQPNY